MCIYIYTYSIFYFSGWGQRTCSNNAFGFANFDECVNALLHLLWPWKDWAQLASKVLQMSALCKTCKGHVLFISKSLRRRLMSCTHLNANASGKRVENAWFQKLTSLAIEFWTKTMGSLPESGTSSTFRYHGIAKTDDLGKDCLLQEWFDTD